MNRLRGQKGSFLLQAVILTALLAMMITMFMGVSLSRRVVIQKVVNTDMRRQKAFSVLAKTYACLDGVNAPDGPQSPPINCDFNKLPLSVKTCIKDNVHPDITAGSFSMSLVVATLTTPASCKISFSIPDTPWGSGGGAGGGGGGPPPPH